MPWEDDWRRWTHTTYGLIQAVTLADRLDGGNLANLEANVFASAAWSPSAVGFQSSADRQQGRAGTIAVDHATSAALLQAVKVSLAPTLLIGTVAVLETLLSDILLQRTLVPVAPQNLLGALIALQARLQTNGSLVPHTWAIEGAHEMRILRNVLVHAAGVWSQQGVNDFTQHLAAKTPPQVGLPVSVNVDDVLAYRRVARTLLNAAARA